MVGHYRTSSSKTGDVGAPEQLSRLGVRLLVLARVVVSGLCDSAQHPAPCSVGSLLESLSFFPLPPTHLLSL